MSIAHLFRCALTLVSPELNTKICYRIKFKRRLDLKNPKTLNEKILVMKLARYGTDPLIRRCADKFGVRSYLEEKGCTDILVPLIATYNSVDEINWEALPQSFVMKWNFGCGFNIICRDKSSLNIHKARKLMKKWGHIHYHLGYSEMQYKGVPHKIIIEKFLKDNSKQSLDDYKIYCFNGKAEYIMVCVGRETGHAKFYYFDKSWQMMPYSQDALNAPEGFTLPKPDCLDDLFTYAEILSKPFNFVRSDFYVVNEKVYFGELTFTPSGGLDTGRLKDVDALLGSMVKLDSEIGKE